MCFSASASFSSAFVLSVGAVVSFVYARTTSQKALAGIPLMFAIQQFTEGVLWMTLLHPAWSHWEKPATYAFLVFAQMVWPVYIPLCMLMFERNLLRKKMITVLMITGILLSVYVGVCLYEYPALAIIDKHHIKYEVGFPLAQKWYYGLIYFLPTILSPVVSGIKKLRWIGYLFLISYIITRMFFHFFEVSVWCFFGALISLVVFFIIISLNKGYKEPA